MLIIPILYHLYFYYYCGKFGHRIIEFILIQFIHSSQAQINLSGPVRSITCFIKAWNLERNKNSGPPIGTRYYFPLQSQAFSPICTMHWLQARNSSYQLLCFKVLDYFVLWVEDSAEIKQKHHSTRSKRYRLLYITKDKNNSSFLLISLHCCYKKLGVQLNRRLFLVINVFIQSYKRNKRNSLNLSFSGEKQVCTSFQFCTLYLMENSRSCHQYV